MDWILLLQVLSLLTPLLPEKVLSPLKISKINYSAMRCCWTSSRERPQTLHPLHWQQVDLLILKVSKGKHLHSPGFPQETSTVGLRIATLHHEVSISRALEDHIILTPIQISRPTPIDKALSSKVRAISFSIREVLTSTSLTPAATCKTKEIRGICRETSLTITHELLARFVVSLVT